MKQTRLWLATIATLLCNFSASAHDFEAGGIYYDIISSTDLTVAVTYQGDYYYDYSNEYSGAVTIPSTVTYNSKTYSVTSIGNSAFYYCSRLSSITIPESVTNIGESAFYHCSSLTSVTIPESVTSIGDYAFYNTAWYNNQPDGVIYIGKVLYEYKGTMPDNTSIEVKEGTKGIAGSAFRDCSSLTAITIPEGVTSIGDFAFAYCSSLTSITIPESVTSIGEWAFSGCTGELIVNCNIPSASTYEDGTFISSRFTKVTIGNNVTSVGSFAFRGCSSLTSITLSEGVTSIDYCAFSGCSNLTSITLPRSVTRIGRSAFSDCSSLTSIIIPENSQLASIGSSAFEDCSRLTSITLPESVTSIEDYAFSGCSSLYSATIGSGVQSIGSKAFNTLKKVIWLTNTPPKGYINAKGTTNYVANDQYTSLGNVKVYPYLSSMFEVNGVKYVPVSPSERTCHAIDCAYDSTTTVINVGETASFKGVAMKVTEVMPYTFYGNDYIKEVAITHLGNVSDYTFYDCDSLNSITLGDNISSLGNYAFCQCSNLQKVIIPSSVNTIGGYCFSGCSALTDIELGCNVATINNYAFQKSSSLPEITLPQAVTKVGDYVFAGCSKLADVIIEDRTTELSLGSNGSSALFADCPLDSVYIGGKITYSTTSSKGYSPFYRNTSLRSVVITDREEQIYDNEFYGCTNLQNVTIGNGVKSIGNYAFSGCSSLAGFSFGSNMETIGAEAFSDCTRLTNITSHAAVPPTCGTQALDDINKWSCTLRVPSGYASAYQGADQWKEFFFVDDVVEVAKYTLTFMVDGEVCHTSSLVHKAEITIPDAPTKEGYTFSGWNEVPETMPAEDVVFNGFFTINKYLVTFKIGAEVISSESLEYGANIVVPVVPEKKGHSFNGWGEVAKTVPAGDLTYEGSYSVNSYLLTYMVDGEIVQSDSIAYGTKLVTPKAPTKEGHTFSGWEKVPATMPAEDIVISGSFAVNTYKVYYYVGDVLVYTVEVAYGESISEYVYEPTTEGDIFEGWVGENHEIMPAHDVVYIANITNGISLSTLKSQESVLIYDLQGRRVLDTENLKGMYIINGKKVVYN